MREIAAAVVVAARRHAQARRHIESTADNRCTVRMGGQQCSQPSGAGHAIGIQKHDWVAAGTARANIPGSRRVARVAAGPAHGCAGRFGPLRRIVGRAVIDHNDFYRRTDIPLRGYGGDYRGNPLSLVPGGYDDADDSIRRRAFRCRFHSPTAVRGSAFASAAL